MALGGAEGITQDARWRRVRRRLVEAPLEEKSLRG
jgi:hypothetical protein